MENASAFPLENVCDWKGKKLSLFGERGGKCNRFPNCDQRNFFAENRKRKTENPSANLVNCPGLCNSVSNPDFHYVE
jgi:hypothetical protein